MRTLTIALVTALIAFNVSQAWAKKHTKKTKRVEITFSDADSKQEIPDLRSFSSADMNSANPISAAARRWLRLDETKLQDIEDESERAEALDQNLE